MPNLKWKEFFGWCIIYCIWFFLFMYLKATPLQGVFAAVLMAKLWAISCQLDALIKGQKR